MRDVLFFLASLASVVAASPIEAPAPTTTTTTTSSPASTTTTPSPATETTETVIELTESPLPNLDNLCMGLGLNDASNIGPIDNTNIGDLLDLGALEECVGDTIHDKPLSHVLSGLGGLLGSGED
ncbi:hypothetical protein BDW69DRAFT_184537 [Aspergillus filifer]